MQQIASLDEKQIMHAPQLEQQSTRKKLQFQYNIYVESHLAISEALYSYNITSAL